MAARSIAPRPASRLREAPREARLEEVGADLLDVPAVVVCANCGDPECPGCAGDEPTQASGVIAIVPWERPGLGLHKRLWATARLSTTSEAFFAALPDGDVTASLRFALLAELLAVAGLSLVFVPTLFLAAPWLLSALAQDATLRDVAVRALLSGVPSLALAMVAIHAAHGIGLDMGARRQGARPRRGRGLRFGLYACGWDLVTLPLGLALVAATEGFGAALRTAPLSLRMPSRAARSYLRGVHQLDEKRAKAAARFGVLTAGTLIVIGASLITLVTLSR